MGRSGTPIASRSALFDPCAAVVGTGGELACADGAGVVGIALGASVLVPSVTAHGQPQPPDETTTTAPRHRRRPRPSRSGRRPRLHDLDRRSQLGTTGADVLCVDAGPRRAGPPARRRARRRCSTSPASTALDGVPDAPKGSSPTASSVRRPGNGWRSGLIDAADEHRARDDHVRIARRRLAADDHERHDERPRPPPRRTATTPPTDTRHVGPHPCRRPDRAAATAAATAATASAVGCTITIHRAPRHHGRRRPAASSWRCPASGSRTSPSTDRSAPSTATTDVVPGHQRLGTDGVAGAATAIRPGIWGGPPPTTTVTCPITVTVQLGSTGPATACVEQALFNRRLRPGHRRRVVRHRRPGRPDVVPGRPTASPPTAWPAPGRRASSASGAARRSRRPSSTDLPANSGTGRRVVYSRAQQRVWAVEADGTVVKTHRVSGRTYEPYAGTYYVYSRSMYTYSAANPAIKFATWSASPTGRAAGASASTRSRRRTACRCSPRRQLGQPLSGGCVRQSTADAQWMWNWAGVGTKVVVL